MGHREWEWCTTSVSRLESDECWINPYQRGWGTGQWVAGP